MGKIRTIGRRKDGSRLYAGGSSSAPGELAGSARAPSEYGMADPTDRLPLHDLVDQDRARPVLGDRGRDSRLAVVEDGVLSIRSVDRNLAAQAGRAINLSLTLRNWLIGCYIETTGNWRLKWGCVGSVTSITSGTSESGSCNGASWQGLVRQYGIPGVTPRNGENCTLRAWLVRTDW
jgi:hypothetical protein